MKHGQDFPLSRNVKLRSTDVSYVQELGDLSFAVVAVLFLLALAYCPTCEMFDFHHILNPWFYSLLWLLKVNSNVRGSQKVFVLIRWLLSYRGDIRGISSSVHGSRFRKRYLSYQTFQDRFIFHSKCDQKYHAKKKKSYQKLMSLGSFVGFSKHLADPHWNIGRQEHNIPTNNHSVKHHK